MQIYDSAEAMGRVGRTGWLASIGFDGSMQRRQIVESGDGWRIVEGDSVETVESY